MRHPGHIRLKSRWIFWSFCNGIKSLSCKCVLIKKVSVGYHRYIFLLLLSIVQLDPMIKEYSIYRSRLYSIEWNQRPKQSLFKCKLCWIRFVDSLNIGGIFKEGREWKRGRKHELNMSRAMQKTHFCHTDCTCMYRQIVGQTLFYLHCLQLNLNDVSFYQPMWQFSSVLDLFSSLKFLAITVVITSVACGPIPLTRALPEGQDPTHKTLGPRN